MATIDPPAGPKADARAPYVPRISEEESARRNRAMIALLDNWEQDGDAEEQRETMRVLREALGPNRVASSRNLFP